LRDPDDESLLAQLTETPPPVPPAAKARVWARLMQSIRGGATDA
jgi:hypothetical protein